MKLTKDSRFALLVLGALAALACTTDSSKSPTAPPANPIPPPPPASAINVTVGASRGQLEQNSTSPSTLTITAVFADSGAAVPNLSPVTVTTNIGNLQSVGGPTTVDLELVGGQVTIPFFAGSTLGTASIRASVTSGQSSGVGFGSIRVVEAGQPPTFFIGSVSPNVGSPQGGDTVTIQGGGFDPPTRVTFSGSAATVLSTSETQIRVRTPPSPSPVPAGQVNPVTVSVTINLNEDGEQSDSLPSGFTYANGGSPGVLQPTVFSVTPSSGPNEGGTEVTLVGDGFQAPVQVKFGTGTNDTSFNGQEAVVLSVSQTRIVVRSPATSSPGNPSEPTPNSLSNILVKNLDTGRFTIALAAFKYGSKVVITAMGPGSGPYTGGTLVTIFGQGFDEPVAAQFNSCGSSGGIGQQVLSVSGTEIQLRTVGVIPTSCANINCSGVGVTNIETGDGATASIGFVYVVPKALITNVSPNSGPQAGNTTVNISGQNFESPVEVTFTISGSVFNAAVVSVSSGLVVVKSPAVPDSVFTTQPCDADADGTNGAQKIPTAATVKITNLITGCADDFANSFTYTPTSSACVGD
ncbi:MAG: IPT/TIG domain-containing protein [Thermoanaerobaculia bacterium]